MRGGRGGAVAFDAPMNRVLPVSGINHGEGSIFLCRHARRRAGFRGLSSAHRRRQTGHAPFRRERSRAARVHALSGHKGRVCHGARKAGAAHLYRRHHAYSAQMGDSLEVPGRIPAPATQGRRGQDAAYVAVARESAARGPRALSRRIRLRDFKHDCAFDAAGQPRTAAARSRFPISREVNGNRASGWIYKYLTEPSGRLAKAGTAAKGAASHHRRPDHHHGHESSDGVSPTLYYSTFGDLAERQERASRAIHHLQLRVWKRHSARLLPIQHEHRPAVEPLHGLRGLLLGKQRPKASKRN